MAQRRQVSEPNFGRADLTYRNENQGSQRMYDSGFIY